MGRPIPRKFFGPLDPATSAAGKTWSRDGFDPQERDLTAQAKVWNAGFNMPVEQAQIKGGVLDVGGNATETPHILAQRGSRKFKVRTASGDGDCFLVNGDGGAVIGEGQMVLAGFVNDEGVPVSLRRINRRKAYDFNGIAYKWYIESDGSTLANRIVLVPLG